MRNCLCWLLFVTVLAEPEPFVVTRLLEFADFPPTSVPCYPISQHLAEKVHALTRPHGTRENSRVKDLVDVAIIAEGTRLDASEAAAAVRATFAARNTHAQPDRLPPVPRTWDSTYRRLASEVGTDAATLEEGFALGEALINPLLDGSATGTWTPGRRAWA